MKLWALINLPRSLGVIILYLFLPCRADVDKDLRRLGVVNPNWWQLHMVMIRMKVFRNLFFFRIGQYRPLLVKLCKIAYRPFDQFGVCADKIGGGMTVYHGNSTIVFAKEIGENFSVYQQVTLGRGKSINGNDCPIIGNNVTVYAGAIIVGGVRIGDGATIGAGAVVVKDVPANAVVVGAPVRVILK